MLYIIKNDYFLTDYILDRLSPSDDVRVIRFARRSGRHSFVRKIGRYFDVLLDFKGDKTAYFDSLFLDQLTHITAQDSVLFFGVENQKDLILLSRIIPAGRKTLWAWNPLSTIIKAVIGTGEYGTMLRKNGIDVYTFDPNDATKYGFHCTNQVYADDHTPERAIKHDIFFVGNDKERIEQLYELSRIFEHQGVSYSFHVVRNRRKKYDAKYDTILTDSVIPYAESIELIKESKAVLDILQPNQSGQTLRPLEALFLGRKLITNNVSVVDEPFYHPQIIFILGKDDINHLPDFLATPFRDPDPKIKERYEVNSWVNQFR